MTVVTTFALLRFLHALSLMMVFGAAFCLAMLRPTALRLILTDRLTYSMRCFAILAGICFIAWLPLESAMIGASWGSAMDGPMLSTLVFDTGIGQVWRLRIVLSLLTVALAFSGSLTAPASIRELLNPQRRMRLLAVCAGAELASLSLLGHAASTDGLYGALHRANDALHALASGAWIGSLPIFLLLFRYNLNVTADPVNVIAAMKRLSVTGHVTVSLTLVTGALNTWFIIGGWPLPWHDAYQALLDLKIALSLLMVALAVTNRYFWVPRLKLTPLLAAAHIRRRARVCVGLAIAVVALVALFGALSPT